MEEAKHNTLKLLDKKEVAKDTYAFHFEKPDGFTFIPGQSMRLAFPDSDENRTFTIASAPHEKNLLFAMRMRGSQFKKKLDKHKTGESVEADGPFGHRFVLHSDTSIPAVFIAGGIGITPFLSILSYIGKKQLPYNIVLFYSNKRPEDIAFLDTLEEYKKENNNFTLITTITRPGTSKDSWNGAVGRIDKAVLAKYVSELSKPFFYIAGSPMMVVGMSRTLEKAGVPAENILTKKFTGYEA